MFSESCWTQSEQVKNNHFERGCRWFQQFPIDFQLYYFLTRVIQYTNDLPTCFCTSFVFLIIRSNLGCISACSCFVSPRFNTISFSWKVILSANVKVCFKLSFNLSTYLKKYQYIYGSSTKDVHVICSALTCKNMKLKVLHLDRHVQSNLHIKGTQGNLKMCPLWAVALYIQAQIYALFINEKNEAALYRQ